MTKGAEVDFSYSGSILSLKTAYFCDHTAAYPIMVDVTESPKVRPRQFTFGFAANVKDMSFLFRSRMAATVIGVSASICVEMLCRIIWHPATATLLGTASKTKPSAHVERNIGFVRNALTDGWLKGRADAGDF